MFVFRPKQDMRRLRAKEIKDSLNSQAVPKILVHKNMSPRTVHFLLFPFWSG